MRKNGKFVGTKYFHVSMYFIQENSVNSQMIVLFVPAMLGIPL